MNKYEYLIEQFKEQLGDNYNLVFNNDEQLNWSDILVEPSKMISGVAHTNSGSYDKINGYSVTTQQLSIQFMIPTDIEIFSEAIQNIEDKFKAFHNAVFEVNSEIIRVLYNYSSDTAKVLINGTDYATMYVYFNVISIENALFSNESIIKVDNKELKGVFNINYANNHTADSVVKGNESLIQKNNVNAIQQTLTIDLVVIKDDALILKLMTECNANNTYNISYYNGLINREFKGYIVNLIENGAFNDTLKVKITFGVANV